MSNTLVLVEGGETVFLYLHQFCHHQSEPQMEGLATLASANRLNYNIWGKEGCCCLIIGVGFRHVRGIPTTQVAKHFYRHIYQHKASSAKGLTAPVSRKRHAPLSTS